VIQDVLAQGRIAFIGIQYRLGTAVLNGNPAVYGGSSRLSSHWWVSGRWDMGEPEMQTGAQLSIDSLSCCSHVRLGHNAISVFGTVAINQLTSALSHNAHI
jgi:hypothetical protein